MSSKCPLRRLKVFNKSRPPASVLIFAAILVALAVCSAWYVVIPAYRQHQAFAEIERLGGRSGCHYTPMSDRLRPLFGDTIADSFLLVDEVDLDGGLADDNSVKIIAQGCPHMRDLTLAGTLVSDDGVANLTAVESLRSLDLSGTKIGDAGLFHLRKLRLESLFISGTRVTNSGIVHLRRMPLQILYMETLSITDEGLLALKDLPLDHLSLSGCPVSNAGLKHIKDLPLLALYLHGTNVTDSGIQMLENSSSVSVISVPVGVSDDTIARFEGSDVRRWVQLSDAERRERSQNGSQ